MIALRRDQPRMVCADPGSGMGCGSVRQSLDERSEELSRCTAMLPTTHTPLEVPGRRTVQR